jgi:hypothetical protein
MWHACFIGYINITYVLEIGQMQITTTLATHEGEDGIKAGCSKLCILLVTPQHISVSNKQYKVKIQIF